MKNQNHSVARIFQECTGLFHICDHSLPYLDARGRGYPSRREAIASLRSDAANCPEESSFTHYLTRSGRKVRL